MESEVLARHQPIMDLVARYEMGSSSAKHCSIDRYLP